MSEKLYEDSSINERVAAAYRLRQAPEPEFPVTVESVTAEVEAIADGRFDAEQAHSREDALYAKVLRTIANTSMEDEIVELALAALKTQTLDFPRWCA